MIKKNTKYLIMTIFVVSMIFFSGVANAFIHSDNPKCLTGKVVYSDDKSPVSDGVVKVVQSDKFDGRTKVLETVNIDQAGNFKLRNQIINLQTEGTKIMAYPNDYDNLAPTFYPTILDFNEKGLNHENLVIEVDRAKDTDPLASSEVNNSILKQNFPNPFNPSTLIRFDLPQTSNVSLKVYDMKGKVVYTLIDNKNYLKGMNELEFNAGSLPSGIYVYSLNAGNYSATRKMMLLK